MTRPLIHLGPEPIPDRPLTPGASLRAFWAVLAVFLALAAVTLAGCAGEAVCRVAEVGR